MPTLSGPLYDIPDVVADQQPQLLPVGQPQFDYVSPDTGRPRVVIDTSEKKPKLIAVDHDPFATVKKIGNKLFGLNGEERYQLWPEKVIREGLSAAHDVMTEGMLPPGLRREDFTDIPAPTEPTNDSTALGKFLNIAPVSSSPADKGIEQAQAMSALAGTGGLGGVGNEAGAALGSTPFLRPALKYEGKIYKAPVGGQHLDALPPELAQIFQKQAMSGEDISNFNFGFMNHKGQFLDREKALDYGIKEGLIDPQDAKFGTLTSTMMSDSSKPGTAIEALKYPKKSVLPHLGKADNMNDAMEYMWNKASNEGVPNPISINPKDLIATQDWLTWKNWNKSQNLGENAYPTHIAPTVFKIGDKQFIIDGHHRINRAYIDKTPIKAHVYDIPLNKAKDFLQLYSDTSKPGMALQANKPFYSAVENAVSSAKQPTADAAQWLGYLKNQPGVKPEELDWTGLKSFLEENKGKPVTKAQIEEHLAANKVELKEVVKNIGETKRTNQYGDILERDVNTGDTKYHSYQLPGGENYREHLLTLPPKELPLNLKVEKASSGFDAAETNPYAKPYSVKTEDGTVLKTFKTEAEANAFKENPNLSAADKSYLSRKTTQEYKSSHWDEPNVLAHIRMNDRNIDGKKTLHVEEVQSDWHQEGRKKGYKDLAKEKEMQAKSDEAMNRAIALNDQMEKLSRDRDPVTNMMRDEKLFHELARQRDAAKAEMNEASKQINQGVPDAPFKKTWDELALKHILNHAVRNGYDQVSWTPGEAQAARYDLSKQVDAIRANKNPDGTYQIGLKKPGHNMGRPTKEMESVPADKLADFVGKELAEKIIKDVVKPNEHGKEFIDNGKVYSGLDLKVGGQGMKAFYDKMLVDKMNALTKKYGGKVEQTKIATEPHVKSIEEYAKRLGLPVESKTVQEEYPKSLARAMKQPVHVLKITPELREHVLKKGFPLFSMGLPIYNPVDHDPFKQEKSK